MKKSEPESESEVFSQTYPVRFQLHGARTWGVGKRDSIRVRMGMVEGKVRASLAEKRSRRAADELLLHLELADSDGQMWRALLVIAAGDVLVEAQGKACHWTGPEPQQLPAAWRDGLVNRPLAKNLRDAMELGSVKIAISGEEVWTEVTRQRVRSDVGLVDVEGESHLVATLRGVRRTRDDTLGEFALLWSLGSVVTYRHTYTTTNPKSGKLEEQRYPLLTKLEGQHGTPQPNIVFRPGVEAW